MVSCHGDLGTFTVIWAPKVHYKRWSERAWIQGSSGPFKCQNYKAILFYCGYLPLSQIWALIIKNCVTVNSCLFKFEPNEPNCVSLLHRDNAHPFQWFIHGLIRFYTFYCVSISSVCMCLAVNEIWTLMWCELQTIFTAICNTGSWENSWHLKMDLFSFSLFLISRTDNITTVGISKGAMMTVLVMTHMP